MRTTWSSDEAHHLEDIASDAFGFKLETWRTRRDLDRIAHSPLAMTALKSDDGARADAAHDLREEIARANGTSEETFAALGTLLPEGTDRLRITGGFRASDDRWLPIELAAEADGRRARRDPRGRRPACGSWG